MSRKDVYIPALVGLVLVGLAATSYAMMVSRADRFQRAVESVEDCQNLVGQIEKLKTAPKLAALEADSSTWLGERIEAVRDAVGIPQSKVVRIEPQPSVRLGRSQYRVTPTRIELKDVTLREIARLAGSLADEANGLTVRDLEFSRGNRPDLPDEQWDAEFTLTQLVFSPTTR
ncbi:hypothetical protein OAH18_01880 [bacterium]|nr:hypothetical protein [bacterium]